MEKTSSQIWRALWVAAVVFATLAALGIAWLDPLIAAWVAAPPAESPVWGSVTGAMDLVAAKGISSFVLGPVLLLAAAAARFLPGAIRLYRPLLYVGLVQFVATVATDLSKPPFGRLRPFESIAQSHGADVWFVGANSFPSGHAGFYAGLFLPLMVIFPRWAIPLAIPPLFIASARVMQNHHYLSDVSAGIAVAALSALAFGFILRRDSSAPR